MDVSHGVVYTPAALAKVAEERAQFAAQSHDYDYVYIYWLDLWNTPRIRVVPAPYFAEILKSNRPGLNVPKAALGVVGMKLPEGFSAVGEYLYALDSSSMRLLHGVSEFGRASGKVLAVLGNCQEKDSTSAVGRCPRTTLKRLVDNVKRDFGVEFLVGFESEFILLKSTTPLEAASVHQYSTSAGLVSGSVATKVLAEIADNIQKSGIELQMVHCEAAPGQYEVVTGPRCLMEAADALVFTREIIIHTATKHGLTATFAPRPFANGPGSACHVHISVHASSETKVPDNLSNSEEMFLAGVLKHLPSSTQNCENPVTSRSSVAPWIHDPQSRS